MDYQSLPVIAIFAPFLAAFIVAIIGHKSISAGRAVTILATLVSLAAVIAMIQPVFVDGEIIKYWMGNWDMVGIGLQVDAIGLLVALIIAFMGVISSIYATKYTENDDSIEKYNILFLFLYASMIAFVFSADLFNMYVMIEIMTFAAIALTAYRNNLYKSIEAGFKYIVTGSLGSVFILLGTVLIYGQTGTLNIAQISLMFSLGGTESAVTLFALACMLTGYAVKAFLVPTHTWPPDAHMSAPSSVSMILSGVMSKTGVYGLIRIVFMVFGGLTLGNPVMARLIIIWGTITMVVGASLALVQSDFKRLLAFSSVSQIGYIVVGFGVALLGIEGVSAVAATGAFYYMLNHAIFKALLFLSAGAVLYKTGTTDLNKLGGLAKRMPITTTFFVFGMLGIAGIPPFNGFAAKWVVYQTTFQAGYWPITIIALVVSVMTFAYLLKAGYAVFFGAISKEHENITELPKAMMIPMGVLATLCLVFGVAWKWMANMFAVPAASALFNQIGYIGSMVLNETLVEVPQITGELAGYYNPLNWLVLFVVLLVGVIVVAMTMANKYQHKGKLEDTAYEVFSGGEAEEYSQLGEMDLLWGLRSTLDGYFGKLRKLHSGVVNDYALGVVATLAVVTLYIFALV